MPDNKKKSSLMATLAACAVFVALISFFLPLYSVNFFATFSYSGFDAVMEALEDPEFPELGIALCLVCSIISVFCSLLALGSSGAGIGTILLSATGMILMIVSLSDDSNFIKAIDYAAIGFYLYETMSLLAIILSAAAYVGKKTVPATIPYSESVTASVPKPPTPVKNFCPKCRKANGEDAAFCRYCGTALNRKLSKSKHNGVDAPVPRPKPKPKKVCFWCETKNDADAVVCHICGASLEREKDFII